MARFIYQPMSYKDYLTKYVNTLKTGELLVDLDNDDIFISEEGINIPLPKTTQLKKEAINFLENDTEGIKIKNELAGRKLKYLENIKSITENTQQSAFDILNDRNLQANSNTSRSIYLEKINTYNIQQLGTIKLDIENIETQFPNYKNRLDNLVKEFNNLSTYNGDINYSTIKNQELMSIYNELNSLLVEINKKLNNMSDLTGTVNALRSTSIPVTLWDVGFQQPAAWIANSTAWVYHNQWDSITNSWDASKIIHICCEVDSGNGFDELRTGILCNYNKMGNPHVVWADWARPVYNWPCDTLKLNYNSSHDDRWNVMGNRNWPYGGPPKTLARYDNVGFNYSYLRNNSAIRDGNGVYIPIATDVGRNPHPWLPCSDATLSVSHTGYYNAGSVNQGGWGDPYSSGSFTHYRMGRVWYCGNGTITTFKSESIPFPRK